MATASAGPRGTVDAKQSFVEAVPLPAALLDDRGRIVALNTAWDDEAQPGALVAPTDKTGQDHVHDLRDEKGFHRDAGKTLADAVDKVLAGQERGQCQYDLGDLGHWEATISRLAIEDEVFVLLVHRNISDERRISELGHRVSELMMQHEATAAVARDRNRLMAAAEQEFHAPMTPIRLQLHLLMSGALGDLDKRQGKALSTVDRNIRRLWDLQERLFNALNAMDAAAHNIESVDVDDVLAEALQPFQERALKAGVRLRIDRGEHAMPAKADRRSVVQAMMLLLDHAVRETPAGGLVWVRLRDIDSVVELSIQDQDPQMDPDVAQGLLTSSGRESSLRSGLLHVLSTMERQGGDLSVDCRGPGQGLEVKMTLPRAPEAEAPPEEARQHA